MKDPNALIKHAVETTVRLIKTKVSPTEALKKVASDLDLNSNYIQRVGEVLNVALHHDHFKHANDKSVDFPVADIPYVKKAFFTEQPNKEMQKAAEWFPAVRESIDYNKILKNSLYKQAYVSATKLDDTQSFPTTFKGVFKQAVDFLQRCEKEIDELKTKQAALAPLLEHTYWALNKELKKDAGVRPAFEEIESQVFSNHGEKAIPFLDFVYKSAALKEERGVHDSGYQLFEPSKATTLFGRLMEIGDKTAKINQEIEEAQAEYDENYKSFKEACVKVGNPVLTNIKKKVEETAVADIEKKAVSDKMHTFSLIGEMLRKYKDNHTQKPDEPIFGNSSKDNKEKEMILQELIMADPILAKADPHKIVAAYEQLLKIAPHVAQQKEVVRSHLRSSLASIMPGATGSALLPLEAKQLAETNTELMRQREMISTKFKPKSDNFKDKK